MNNIYNCNNIDTNNDSNISNNINLVNMYKMAFIYNSILNGWTVRKLKDGKFEFSKNKDEIKEFHLENFLEKFVDMNLNMSQILETNN